MELLNEMPEKKKAEKKGIVEMAKKIDCFEKKNLHLIFQLIEDEIKRLDEGITLTRKAVGTHDGYYKALATWLFDLDEPEGNQNQ